jgi:two-component system chemotaxis response regulator CheB
MPGKTRVLVVDDSAFMRKMLSQMITSDPDLEVIKTARDGLEALKAVEEIRPDVVTMDIELPEIDGLTCVAYIMEQFPTPVIIVTGFSQFLGEETVKALELGAVGLVRKPGGPISRNLDTIKQELLHQIRLAGQVDVRKLTPVVIKETKPVVRKPTPQSTRKVVVIASSSGGPRALSQIIPKLPADLPAGVVVVQHMPAEFVPSLSDRLNWESTLEVKVAQDGEPIKQGKVLIAPGDAICSIRPNGAQEGLIKLTSPSRREEYCLSSADKLMRSLAPIYGRNATGVVLTGMGSDGTEGLRAIKEHGGYTISEDESTCVVYGMPRSAVRAGVVDRSLPLPEIAEEIVRTVKRRYNSGNENNRIQATLSK